MNDFYVAAFVVGLVLIIVGVVMILVTALERVKKSEYITCFKLIGIGAAIIISLIVIQFVSSLSKAVDKINTHYPDKVLKRTYF